MLKPCLGLVLLVLVLGVPEAHAERASVATCKAAVVAAKAAGKATVIAGKATVKAAKAVPKGCPWHGLKWLAKHI